jgi:hypothetical protein
MHSFGKTTAQAEYIQRLRRKDNASTTSTVQKGNSQRVSLPFGWPIIVWREGGDFWERFHFGSQANTDIATASPAADLVAHEWRGVAGNLAKDFANGKGD